jgi:hypothetical protein
MPGGQKYIDGENGDIAALAARVTALEQLMASKPWESTLPPPTVPTLGFATYTEADRVRWIGTHPEYVRLRDSWAGNLARPWGIPSAIPAHESTAQKLMLETSIIAKAQALLDEAVPDPARRKRVTDILDAVSAMSKTWPSTVPKGDASLSLGWALNNLVQAAWIVGYDKAKLGPVLRAFAPFMDWWGSPNWVALYAAVRLQIFGWLGDAAGVADSVDYFAWHLERSVWLTSDGPNVKGLPAYSTSNVWPARKTLTPSPSQTRQHWFNQTNGTDFVLIYPANGRSGEDSRDLAHVSQGLKSWCDAALAIIANGGIVPAASLTRLRAFAELHGQRCLRYFQDGTLVTPPPLSGGAGSNNGALAPYCWHTARKLLGPSATLDALVATARVRTADAPGANQQTCEAFAEGVSTS